MANQVTNVSNSYESTLSSSLGAGDTTINVTSTDGTPGVPFFVVIDPGEDAKREVVLVDSGKTGNTFTLSSAAQRGQDGTTDVAHDANATIGIYPIAAHWRDINDRVSQHAHSGGTDGAAVATASLSGHDKAAHDALGLDHGLLSGLGDDDHSQYLNNARHDTTDRHGSTVVDHGSIGGLGDDDHSQYSLVSGARAFTGTVGGVTPTTDAHLATKGYVDSKSGQLVDFRNVNQSISHSADTTVVFDATELGASGEFWGRSSGVYTANADAAGRWRVTAQAAFASNATGRRNLIIRRNLASVSTNRENANVEGDHYIQVVSKVLQIAAGDTIDVRVFQSSGGALNLLGGAAATWISFEKVG